MPVTRSIHGPLVSTGDLEAQLALFAVFGLREVARRAHDADECTRQWGTREVRAVEVLLETPGTPWGARLLAFDPPSPQVVRDRSRGFDADAPKVIDFYCPDFAAGRAAVERAGWQLREPLAEYDLPEGHFVEGHVWGPDEIVCALLGGPADFFRGFATVTDRTFSEPQSLSGPVSRLEPAVEWFERALGLSVVYRYGIDDESFRQLVGSERPQFRLRAVNLGLASEQPYFGLIHYGMPEGSYASLAGRARPPHRGTLGATVEVEDVDEAVRRGLAGGGELLAAPAECELAGFGRRRSALVMAPNGGCYQLLSAS